VDALAASLNELKMGSMTVTTEAEFANILRKNGEMKTSTTENNIYIYIYHVIFGKLSC
jgi:hypothetical protein